MIWIMLRLWFAIFSMIMTNYKAWWNMLRKTNTQRDMWDRRPTEGDCHFQKIKTDLFPERCGGRVKNQNIRKILNPSCLLNSLQIIKLYNGEVTKLFLMNGLYMLYFQRLFFNMAKKSGFDYEIHDNFETSAGIVKIIDKHSSQSSTIKIKELNDPLFSLIKMNIVEKWLKKTCTLVATLHTTRYPKVPMYITWL